MLIFSPKSASITYVREELVGFDFDLAICHILSTASSKKTEKFEPQVHYSTGKFSGTVVFCRCSKRCRKRIREQCSMSPTERETTTGAL